MKYEITHTTTYQYHEPVAVCHNEARLKPGNSKYQHCQSARLSVDPEPSDWNERVDFFGNQVTYFAINQPHQTLRVTARSIVETRATPKQNSSSDTVSWQRVRELLEKQTGDLLEAKQYTLASPMIIPSREMAEYAERSFSENRPLTSAVRDLVERIHRDFNYDPNFSTVATPLRDVLKHRRGVCQDFAHLAIGCIRSLGLAARYVSGYIETLPPKGQPRLVGADASHAWFSVFVPETGWMDFDPTNNQLVFEKHITVAMGRDYQDVSPLKGVIFGGGEHQLDVSVDVANIQ